MAQTGYEGLAPAIQSVFDVVWRQRERKGSERAQMERLQKQLLTESDEAQRRRDFAEAESKKQRAHEIQLALLRMQEGGREGETPALRQIKHQINQDTQMMYQSLADTDKKDLFLDRWRMYLPDKLTSDQWKILKSDTETAWKYLRKQMSQYHLMLNAEDQALKNDPTIKTWTQPIQWPEAPEEMSKREGMPEEMARYRFGTPEMLERAQETYGIASGVKRRPEEGIKETYEPYESFAYAEALTPEERKALEEERKKRRRRNR